MPGTDIWAINGGVYFGYGTNVTKGVPRLLKANRIQYVGDRHLVTIGPTGSGKSRRLLLPNLEALTGWSMLVIDPKGELAYMTAGHRNRRGNRIIRLNPFNALGLGSDGFNPITALDPHSEDFPDDAMGMAEALIRVEGREPHWSQSAQDLVCALIMYVRLVIPDGSLADVRHFVAQSGDQLRQTVGAKTIDYNGRAIPGMIAAGIVHDCPELEAKAARFADITPENRELLSILSTAMTQTRWLDSRPVKADLREGSIDFSMMKKEPTTVYLILPARRLSTHSTWLRLMIASVLQPLLKDTRKAEVPILFMLDEFAQLGHLPVIENAVGLMRGYGIKLWAVLQDLSQVQHIYEQRWESFLGNAGALQSFAPQDVVTADYLSKRTGQTSRAALGGNIAGDQTGISMNQVGVPLMLPQDLRNMDDGFAVIFSNKTKGTIRAFLPFPTALPQMRGICALDPA